MRAVSQLSRKGDVKLRNPSLPYSCLHTLYQASDFVFPEEGGPFPLRPINH